MMTDFFRFFFRQALYVSLLFFLGCFVFEFVFPGMVTSVWSFYFWLFPFFITVCFAFFEPVSGWRRFFYLCVGLLVLIMGSLVSFKVIETNQEPFLLLGLLFSVILISMTFIYSEYE
jgi:uncharacterized oligopeptide transporter (OPT) family protein